ncbi:MAG: chorismate-binding protein [Atopobiaceae bacterium]|jgi:anthranilate synthase component 1
MEFRPTLDEVRSLAAEGTYGSIPVSCEILSDSITPLVVLRRLQFVSDQCFLLESAEAHGSRGRYSFLGYDPRLCISAKDGRVSVEAGGTTFARDGLPGDVIRAVLAESKAPRLDYLPPFAGGLVGYFSYDYLKYSEPTLVLDAHDDEDFADLDLMMFDKVVAFDSYAQKAVLICDMPVPDDAVSLEAAYHHATDELASMRRLVLEGEQRANVSGRITSPVRTLFDEGAYAEMVRRAQEFIKAGDIFQVVLSNRLDADFEGTLLDTYRLLRTINPSPYLIYLASSELEVAASSPETLVRLQDGEVFTFPLAGTRPRGATPELDLALERDLLADEKELAEHNMLVDLGRNDVGKISEFGSVRVEKHLAVERFSHVMHLGSTISGHIRQGCDAIDAIDSILPAGTLSGAPKIRAAQIINELEDNKRGIYGGTIGYIDLAGNLDMCIAIRLAYHKNGKVFVRSGAGIVADSVPGNEYRECVNKARAVVAALESAQRGLD